MPDDLRVPPGAPGPQRPDLEEVPHTTFDPDEPPPVAGGRGPPPRSRDVNAFEVVSWILIACVGVASAAVAILFGVPAALALVLLVAIAGGIWWWKVASTEEIEEGPPPRPM